MSLLRRCLKRRRGRRRSLLRAVTKSHRTALIRTRLQRGVVLLFTGMSCLSLLRTALRMKRREVNRRCYLSSNEEEPQDGSDLD